MRRIFLSFLALFFSLAIASGSARGAKLQRGKRPVKGIHLKELGFLSGWREGPLDKADNYRIIPFILRFGFNLTPLVKRIHPPGLLELEVEPFLSEVLGPESNVEGGFNLLVKYAYPLTSRFFPYIEVGTGLLYTSQHFEEQATHLNSIVQGGVGFQYFFRKSTALDVGYRFRHFSNAGIKEPNEGINTQAILIGISFFY